MTLDKPRFCACGNPAALLKQHEPICERCNAMEIALNVTKKKRATSGISTGEHRPMKVINWDQYWIPFTDSSPIAGASSQVLDFMLAHAEQVLKAA